MSLVYSTRAIFFTNTGQVPEGVPKPLKLKPLPKAKMQALENVLHVFETHMKLLTRVKPEILQHWKEVVSHQRGLIAGTWEPPVPHGLYTELVKHKDDPNKGRVPEGELCDIYRTVYVYRC